MARRAHPPISPITLVPRLARQCGLLALLLYPTSAHPAACVSEAEVEAVVGEQVRSGAFAVRTEQLGDRPLCSGLTMAQTIQELRQRYFPLKQVPAPVVDDGDTVQRLPPPNKIPSNFHGRWEKSLRDCSGEFGVEAFAIDADGISYYETRDHLQRIVVNSPTDITVNVTGEYGPDQWRETHTLRLSSDGKRITFVGSGKFYVRCPAT